MNTTTATVYLVGAGPGDPGLVTVRGLELVKTADVLVYDRLVAAELVGQAQKTTEKINVGKAPGKHRYSQRWINALLVDRARKGLTVVRLKGGDPFLFGRGFEELTACRKAGVACEVIPGVSSALAAPAAAAIPITNRGSVRSVAIVTGQTAGDASVPPLDYKALAAMDTIVVLMGRANLKELTHALMAAGCDPVMPACCIEWATTPAQRTTVGTLQSIADAADRDGLSAPVVTVFGQVAAAALDTRQDLGSSPLSHPDTSVSRVS